MIRKYRKSLAVCLKTSALLVSFASGYGRALAGSCYSIGGSYVCSGATDLSADNTIHLYATPLTVTTSPDFGIDTTVNGGNAFNLYSDGGITFLDRFSSSITGSSNGIVAVNLGAGNLSITTDGQVAGAHGIGIWADNHAAGSDLDIAAGDVSGQDDGINARNSGVGRLSISISGTVYGTDDNGIYALNSVNGSDLNISVATVTGGNNGIVATNNGRGNLSIASTGDVTGTGGIGIWANNSVNGGDLRISATSVFGGSQGINARNSGNGRLSISTSGTVHGTAGDGIYAWTSANGTDLSISTVNVLGGSNGIVATNNGHGNLSIASTGDVTGTGGIGIWANNSANGGDLNISAASVFGGSQGINARNSGNGALTINAGTVVGNSFAGIWAENAGGATDLAVSVAGATSGYLGIVAFNSGSGNLSISSSGLVSGVSGYGIYAENAPTGNNLSLSVADVVGGAYGIRASNQGRGGLFITGTGSIEGTSGVGIMATHMGDGVLSITSSGAVLGGIGGIFALNSPNGDDLRISAGDVNGMGQFGIQAINLGSGALTVDTTGSIYGGAFGIFLFNQGSASTVNVRGQVGGGMGGAIMAMGAPTTVNLFAGSSTTGFISLDSGDDRVNLAGHLTGIVDMSGGDDTFVQYGGSFLDGIVDGGAGNDTLGFYDMGTVDGSLLGTTFHSFENLGIYGGSTTLTGNWDFSSGNATVFAGNLYLNGSLTTGVFAVHDGGYASIIGLLSSTAVLIDGRLDVDGTVNTGSMLINPGGYAGIDGYLESDSVVVGGRMDLGGRLDTGEFTVLRGGFADIDGVLNSRVAAVYGRMKLNGSLTADTLTIASGGFLSGNGTVDGRLINYGTISPGNSIGTLDVNGSAVFMPGSAYLAEIRPDGTSDRIAVNGPVTLRGGTVKTALSRSLYRDGRSWNILSASGGVTGRFSSLSYSDHSETVDLQLSYDSRRVMLEVVRTPYASFGMTPAGVSVGSALDQVVPLAEGGMAGFLTAMDFDMSRSQISATLDALSPELYTSFAGAGLRSAGLVDQAIALHRSGEREAMALGTLSAAAGDGSVPGEWTVWTRALGSRAEQDGHDGFLGLTHEMGGVVFGADRQVAGFLRAGIDLGYTDGELSWDGMQHSGNMQGRHIGAYAGIAPGNFFVDASIGYADLAADASRIIAVDGLTAEVDSDFAGDVWSGRLEGGYARPMGSWLLGPVASLNYARFNQDGFSEHGAGYLDYTIAGLADESLAGTLGVRLSGLISSGSWQYLPRFDLRWLHQFEDDGTPVTAHFNGYPEAAFEIAGVAPASDQGLLSVGLTVGHGNTLLFYMDYAVAVADDSASQLISGGLSWKF